MAGVAWTDEETVAAADVARDLVVGEVGVDALERRVQPLLVDERQQGDTWRNKRIISTYARIQTNGTAFD